MQHLQCPELRQTCSQVVQCTYMLWQVLVLSSPFLNVTSQEMQQMAVGTHLGDVKAPLSVLPPVKTSAVFKRATPQIIMCPVMFATNFCALSITLNCRHASAKPCGCIRPVCSWLVTASPLQSWALTEFLQRLRLTDAVSQLSTKKAKVHVIWRCGILSHSLCYGELLCRHALARPCGCIPSAR
jgi:hypothetical protein